MKCVRPTTVFDLVGKSSRLGKRKISFARPDKHVKFESFDIPCGQCIACRIIRRESWTLRLFHESLYHDETLFLTLTYDDEHLPYGGSLVKDHYQKFVRALRKKLRPQKIRYYVCGEYGGEFGRPHYHLVLFLSGVPDLVPVGLTDKGNPRFSSEILEKCWGKGFLEIQSISPEALRYVCKHHVEKIDDVEHYAHFDEATGEFVQVEPIFGHMSLRPGIGHEWFMDYWRDVYPKDFVSMGGRKIQPPKYYDRLLEKYQPEVWQEVLATRLLVEHDPGESTMARLAAKAVCIKAGAKVKLPPGPYRHVV
jgi:hypothetical protein